MPSPVIKTIAEARGLGLPGNPRHGQVAYDASGQAWMWHADDATGMGMLGFWGALLGVAKGVLGIGGGGGGSSKDTQAILQQNQQLIQQLQEQAAQKSGFSFDLNKKTLAIIGAFALAAIILFRK